MSIILSPRISESENSHPHPHPQPQPTLLPSCSYCFSFVIFFLSVLLSEGTWYKALRTVAQIALLLQAVPVASLALLLQTANAQAAPVDASWYKELLINVKSVEPARAPPTLMAAAVVQQTVFVQPVTILRIVQPMKLVLLPLISNALNVPVPIISPAVQAVWLAVRPALLVRPAQALVPPQGPQTLDAKIVQALVVSTSTVLVAARLLPTTAVAIALSRHVRVVPSSSVQALALVLMSLLVLAPGASTRAPLRCVPLALLPAQPAKARMLPVVAPVHLPLIGSAVTVLPEPIRLAGL